MADFIRFDQMADLPQGGEGTAEYNCPLCEDSGVIVAPDGSLRPCRCWKEKRRAAGLKRSGLPKALQRMCFENFDLSFYPGNRIADENRGLTYLECGKKALNAALKFVGTAKVQPPVTGLMFQGPVGSGKTHLAAAITNELLKSNVDVFFAVVPELLDEFRAAYGGNNGEEIRLMNRVQTASVLVLDDLGAHNFSDWTKNRLFAILNYRLNHELPCIITSNLSVGGLQEILGERIVSRLVAACDIYLLPVDRDIRLARSRG